MTKNKEQHTPGPWTYSLGDDGAVVYKKDQGTIASLTGPEINPEGDAPLIAAAPDLLAAAVKMYSEARLVCLFDHLNPCSLSKDDKHWGGGEKCANCQMVAAIAKAEGR